MSDTDSSDILSVPPEAGSKPAVSLEGMSPKELAALRDTVEAKRQQVLEAAKNEVVSRFQAELEALEVPMADVLPLLAPQAVRDTAKSQRKRRSDTSAGTATTRKGRTLPVLYRNPDNPAEGWAGRGQAPKWLRKKEAQDHKRDEFLVKAPEDGTTRRVIEDL
jgi:DNA-binding protein H-NS